MRPATRLLLVASLLAVGCQTPCGPLWTIPLLGAPASPASVPAKSSARPSPAASAGDVVPADASADPSTPSSAGTATPLPTATARPTARPTAAPTPIPTPTATAAPAGNDISTALLGTWFYSDLKYSSKLIFQTEGNMKTYISNDPGIVARYMSARYTVNGNVVALSITDAPGFEGGSATVSISADGQQMTTNGGKVYKRQ
jgi:hypothetical protein